MTFKIGDRVRLVKDNSGCGEIGNLGTVIGELTGEGDYDVEFDNDSSWYVPEGSLVAVSAGDELVTDREVVALANIVEQLLPLDTDARVRVIEYLDSRFSI